MRNGAQSESDRFSGFIANELVIRQRTAVRDKREFALPSGSPNSCQLLVSVNTQQVEIGFGQ